MSQLTTADVLKLKCLYFELVRNYVEQLQYGILCDRQETLDKIAKLEAVYYINTNCVSTVDGAYCHIKTTLDSIYDYCMKSITPCATRETSCVDCI
jgi:hypothetical protein